MKNNYTETVMKYFKDPKNMGEMEDADAVGEVGSPGCGDIMYIYIKVGKKQVSGKEVEYIKDISFQTMGCIAAIATSSMATELAKGKTLEEAEKITNQDVAESLGSLPKIKMHCSNLAADALRVAIGNYRDKKA